VGRELTSKELRAIGVAGVPTYATMPTGPGDRREPVVPGTSPRLFGGIQAPVVAPSLGMAAAARPGGESAVFTPEAPGMKRAPTPLEEETDIKKRMEARKPSLTPTQQRRFIRASKRTAGFTMTGR